MPTLSHFLLTVNSLPNKTKKKKKKLKFLFGRVENMVGKGENAGF